MSKFSTTPSKGLGLKTRTPRIVRNNKGETIKVYLRLRPPQYGYKETSLEKVDDQRVRTIPIDSSPPHTFSFTHVFEDESNSELFAKVVRPVAEKFLGPDPPKGGLIFTYGNTASGKTYTMEGPSNDPGLIYRTIDYLFDSIGSQHTPKDLIESDGQNWFRINDGEASGEEHLYPKIQPSQIRRDEQSKRADSKTELTRKSDYEYCVFISMIQLYRRQIHDLFEDFDVKSADKKREIREDKALTKMCYVSNAVQIEVKSAKEAVSYYRQAIKKRKTASTTLNQESSRGHCIFNLKVVRVGKKNIFGRFDPNTLSMSQLSLVDLAGIERAKRTNATGVTLDEAGTINRSLGALRKCIRALREGQPPSNYNYREDNLLRLFQSYFVGQCSVNMVLCVNPTLENYHENNIAMEFGLLTQDVTIDYASPPKRSKVFDWGKSPVMCQIPKPNPSLEPDEYADAAIKYFRQRREARKQHKAIMLQKIATFRETLVRLVDERNNLRQKLDVHKKIIKMKLSQVAPSAPPIQCSSPIETRSRSTYSSTAPLAYEKAKKRVPYSFGKTDDRPAYAYEANEANEERAASTSETAESVTECSSDAIDDNDNQANFRTSRNRVRETVTLARTNSGVPIVNPRHNRSYSCPGGKVVMHIPRGTIDTGTVLNVNIKNGRRVKHLRSSDVLRKDATEYSIVHQNADENGHIEQMIYKGKILPTGCGGAQVAFNDIETMKQTSPTEREKILREAHSTG